MSRDWKKFSNDEIYALWQSYYHTEFPGYHNQLGVNRDFTRAVRLTPMEILNLVEELLDRLEIKEKK